MAGEIASAFVRIRPNMAGFKAETEAAARPAFGGLAKIAAGAFAAVAVFDFTKDIVKGAAQVQKSVEVIKDEFGAAGKSVTDFNEHAAAGLGISARAGDAAASKFGILFKNLGIGRGVGAAMTVGMEKLAGSLSAIRGVDPSSVIDKMSLALAGNTRGLKQLGIVVDTHAIKTAALRLGLIKTTKDAIDPATKAQAIYAIATQHLAEFQKQAAEHSGDLINVQRKLSAEWSNAKDELGKKLLPVVTEMVQAFSTVLPGAIKVFSTVFGTVFGQVKEIVVAFKPVFDPVIAAVKAVVAAFESGGIHGALDQLKTSFTNLSTPAKVLVGIVVALGAAVAMTIIEVMPLPLLVLAVAEGFKYAYDHCARFREIVRDIASFLNTHVMPAVRALADSVKNDISGAVDVVRSKWPQLKEIFQTVLNFLEGIWNRFGGQLVGVIRGAIDLVKSTIHNGLQIIEGIFSLIIDVLTGKWGKAWDDIKKVVNGALGLIGGYLRAAVGLLGGIATDIGKAMLAGLTWAWNLIKTAAYKVVLDILEPFSHLPGKMGKWARDAKDSVNAELDLITDHAGKAGAAAGSAYTANFMARIQPVFSAMIANSGGAAGRAAAFATGGLPVTGSKGVDFIGASLAGVKQGFVDAVAAAAKAAGVTQINVTSGARSPGHNAAVGGVSGSKHLTGDALDGMAFIPGQGWIPLGVALQRTAAFAGLRSGNVAGFFNGKKDPVHVDDGGTTPNPKSAAAAAAAAKQAAADAAAAALAPNIGSSVDSGISTAVAHAKKKAIPLITSLSHNIEEAFLVGLQPLPGHLTEKLRSSLETARRAVQKAQTGLTSDFRTMGTDAIKAFDGATSAGLAALKSDFDRKVRATITDPMKDALQALADANKQTNEGFDAAAKALTPTEQIIADLQKQHDAAAAADQMKQAQDALTAAQATGDPTQVVTAQKAIDDLLYNEKITALQAAADVERAARDKQVQDDRDAQASLYADRQQAVQDDFSAKQQALQATYDADVKHYQDERDLQKTHLTAMLATLQTQLAQHPEEWKSVHAKITALFKDTFGPDYATAATNLGDSFAAGLRASFKTVSKAASDMAKLVAKYLKVKSPTELGPMSDLDTWWTRLPETLVGSLAPGDLTRALTGSLGHSGRSGVPQITGALAPLGALVATQIEVLDELRKQTSLARDGQTVHVAVSGSSFNNVIAGAKR